MEDGERGPIKPKQKSAFPSPPPPVGFPLWTLFSLNLHLLTLCRLLLFRANAQTLSLTHNKQKSAKWGKVKEGGEMPTFTAVFFFSPFLLVSPLHKCRCSTNIFLGLTDEITSDIKLNGQFMERRGRRSLQINSSDQLNFIP